jgi:hypothetical protein
MFALILKNWKTSGAALIGALAGIIVVFFPTFSEPITQIAQGLVLLCAALIGLFAKDGDVTGTVP